MSEEEEEKQLSERWDAKDNLVIGDINEKPIAECSSHIIALHIACAHNAVLESAPTL